LYTQQLNTSIKGNRALLLLLPPDVVKSVKVREPAPTGTVGCMAGLLMSGLGTVLVTHPSPHMILPLRFSPTLQALKDTMTMLTKQLL
jgi:hypothetical protein